MEADVIHVDVKNEGDNRYTFKVTVKYADVGWNHYADRWEILTPDTKIVSIRILRHPHVKEQPFTRSLTFVPIPINVNKVIIRAHCSIDEFGGKEIEVDLPQ